MAITKLYNLNIGSFPTDQNNTAIIPTFSSLQLDATSDKFAFIFMVPKSGTLHSFEWRTGTVSNNPDNGMRVSFQDVSLTTGLPDGTQDQFFDMTGIFNSNSWQTPSGPLTNNGTGGGTKRTVTAGEMLACVIEFVNFTTGDNIQVSTIVLGFDVNVNDNLQYIGNASTGTYVKFRDVCPFALKYDDGTYGVFDWWVVPVLTLNTVTFNNASTPDEQALRFQLPFKAEVCGVQIKLNWSAVADIILYDNSNNVLASVSLDPDVRMITNGNSATIRFPGVTCDANTTYRLSVKPTSGSNITMYTFTVNAAGLCGAFPGGAEFYSSTRTDAGAWTDTNTVRPLINLVLSGVDISGGGGGGEFSAVF